MFTTAQERSFVIARATCALLMLVFLLWGTSAARQHPSQNSGATAGHRGLFDADPNNSWDRLRRCLILRKSASGAEYGDDTVDPLLWEETTHLLTGDSHQQAIACLDDFLKTHAEQRIQDPIKRAVFQRDLWAVFDWSARNINQRNNDHPAERRALQMRLAEVLRRVTLTPEQIRALPDTYAQAVKSGKFAQTYDSANPGRPFLPPDIFQNRGPWVCLSGPGSSLTAPSHVAAFSGRSRFLVFMRLPQGREATFEYLHRLWTFPEPLLVNDNARVPLLNLRAPQFPVGTTVALVRQMVLIDKQGNLEQTSLTESLQIRVYHAITPGSPYMNYIGGPASKDQDLFEFRLSRRDLFSGANGGLVAVAPDEKDFQVFQTHGFDMFEGRERTSDGAPRAVVLKSCNSCHADSGIQSLQSRFQLVKPNQELRDPENGDPKYGAVYWETSNTIGWKQHRYDWGLLNGYWAAAH